MPAYNESRFIKKTITECKKVTDNLIVVNDGSTDETKNIIAESDVMCINLEKNTGNSNAIFTGMDFAIRHNYSKVVTIDADGAHSPYEIPSLINIHNLNKSNLTIGNRFSSFSTNNIPSTKRLSNLFASKIINKLLKIKLDDVACGFRVYSSDLISILVKNSKAHHGYRIAYESIFSASNHGLQICNSNVSVHYDGSNLLVTPQKEFLDLLAVLVSNCSSTQYLLLLEKIQDSVINLLPFTIQIENILLCLHPLSKERGYIFQLQDDYYCSSLLGNKYIFD